MRKPLHKEALKIITELNTKLFAEVLKKEPNLQNIKNLVEQGADVNTIDTNGDSLLMNALENRTDIACIELLIELGANVNYENMGCNTLYSACLSKKPDVVELLLKSGANPNYIFSETNESLIAWAEFEEFYVHSNKEMAFTEQDKEAVTKIRAIIKEYK